MLWEDSPLQWFTMRIGNMKTTIVLVPWEQKRITLILTKTFVMHK